MGGEKLSLECLSNIFCLEKTNIFYSLVLSPGPTEKSFNTFFKLRKHKTAVLRSALHY